MEPLDAQAVLLALRSMARAWLTGQRPGQAVPLAGLSPEGFAATSWQKLGIERAGHDALLLELMDMFPGQPGTETKPTKLPFFTTPGMMTDWVYARWLASEQSIVYRSSGSSGVPKKHPHSAEEWKQEVNVLADYFHDVDTIIGLTPQHHCFGFVFGVLLSCRLRAEYLVLPPLPTIFRHCLSEKPQNGAAKRILAVGYPDFWAEVPLQGFTPPKNLICLSAGAPWPDREIKTLQAAGFGSLLEIYGSSENGAIGFRSGVEDFTLLDYWKRDLDKAQSLIRVFPSGIERKAPLQDELKWSGLKNFRPVKRLDSAVQVSGINVFPKKIAELLQEHPQVEQCRVRLMRPSEGRRLKALIVPAPGVCEASLRKELKKICREKLTAPERPVKFSFTGAIPKNNFGKESDWT